LAEQRCTDRVRRVLLHGGQDVGIDIEGDAERTMEQNRDLSRLLYRCGEGFAVKPKRSPKMFTAAGFTATVPQRIKPMIIAGLLALSLMVGAGATATRVGAEPVGPGIDGVSQACRALQNQAQDLIDEYGRVGRANPNDPRLNDLLAQIRSVGTTWQQIGCQAAFGNIIGLRVSAPGTFYRPIAAGSYQLASR